MPPRTAINIALTISGAAVGPLGAMLLYHWGQQVPPPGHWATYSAIAMPIALLFFAFVAMASEARWSGFAWLGFGLFLGVLLGLVLLLAEIFAGVRAFH